MNEDIRTYEQGTITRQALLNQQYAALVADYNAGIGRLQNAYQAQLARNVLDVNGFAPNRHWL